MRSGPGDAIEVEQLKIPSEKIYMSLASLDPLYLASSPPLSSRYLAIICLSDRQGFHSSVRPRWRRQVGGIAQERLDTFFTPFLYSLSCKNKVPDIIPIINHLNFICNVSS